MKKYKINMLSKADSVQAHGVLSAHDEQVKLVKNGLQNRFEVVENKKIRADIMHYHTVNFRYTLTMPFTFGKCLRIGYVHFLPETVDGSIKLNWLYKTAFYWYLIKYYKMMHELVVVNPYFIDPLVKHGIKKERITYIPNFVDEQQFFPLEPKERMLLRQKYQIPDDQFVVICVGQLQSRKGVLDFIEIAKMLPDITFLWAGGFSFGSISAGYHEIKKEKEHPPANLKFLGIIDRPCMNEVYNIADMLFLPSYEELFPMTVLEAMNVKLPILLRDLPIYENILFDYYLRGENNQAFIDIIKRCQLDKSYYQAAQAHAWDGHLFYNKQHVLQMWETFYTSKLAKKRKVTVDELFTNQR
jgi:1,2-diacylglycerol-3-alpha-glucose alpha-1,2-galactosyltransferase